MAPITSHVDQSKDLTVVKCSGKIRFHEFMAVLKELWSGEITKNLLFDMSEGETDEFDESDMLRIVEFVRSLPDPQQDMRAGGKTAIVGIKEHVWGRLRQYKAWSETINTSWEIQVFNDQKKALDWLEVS